MDRELLEDRQRVTARCAVFDEEQVECWRGRRKLIREVGGDNFNGPARPAEDSRASAASPTYRRRSRRRVGD